ncbi:MAG: hypothetical protein K2P39_08010 [Lachnospiraceae bacterium]|nr:hypothetical protein [Lachnospiraceae bacterium]
MRCRRERRKAQSAKNPGVLLYLCCGRILVICAVGSIALLVFVRTLPQDPDKYNIPVLSGVWFVSSLVLLMIGLGLGWLCRKSTRFQKWAERDVMRYSEHQLRRALRLDKKAGRRRRSAER